MVEDIPVLVQHILHKRSSEFQTTLYIHTHAKPLASD